MAALHLKGSFFDLWGDTEENDQDFQFGEVIRGTFSQFMLISGEQRRYERNDIVH